MLETFSSLSISFFSLLRTLRTSSHLDETRYFAAPAKTSTPRPSLLTVVASFSCTGALVVLTLNSRLPNPNYVLCWRLHSSWNKSCWFSGSITYYRTLLPLPSLSEPSKSDGPKKPDPEKEEIDVSARHGKGAKDPFDLSPESINDSKWLNDK